MIRIKRLFKSFKYALTGLNKVFWEEQNFRIDFIIAIIILWLAVFLKIMVWQFIILVLIIALVLILEIINSIFERFVDLLKPRIHEYVKDIKDMTAAAVFIGALASVIIGILIFLPYIVARFFR
ncbi:MAG: diacylglycerol kinase family protein [Candidatus Parcubacteria bacterium]|nr:diacylglycerol kinase family protein [Candidatus Parcubacteria bacterium]